MNISFTAFFSLNISFPFIVVYSAGRWLLIKEIHKKVGASFTHLDKQFWVAQTQTASAEALDLAGIGQRHASAV